MQRTVHGGSGPGRTGLVRRWQSNQIEGRGREGAGGMRRSYAEYAKAKRETVQSTNPSSWEQAVEADASALRSIGEAAIASPNSAALTASTRPAPRSLASSPAPSDDALTARASRALWGGSRV